MMSLFMNYLIVGVSMIPVIAAALLVLPRLSGRFSARVPYLVFLILGIRLLLPWNVTLPDGMSQELTIGAAAFRLPSVVFATRAENSGRNDVSLEELNAAGGAGETGRNVVVGGDSVTGEIVVDGSDNAAGETGLLGVGDAAESAAGTDLAVADGSVSTNGSNNSVNSMEGSGNRGSGTGDSERGLSFVSVLTAIWGLGMAFFLGRYVVSVIQLEKGLKRWRKKSAKATMEACRMVATPQVWICPILSTPMVVGFFSPEIYLPHENYSSRELEMIFTHEMTHIRRHDIWYKLMLFAVRTIHWYNPLVWMLVRRAMNHLEVSCDGDVVAERDSQYRKDYGAMLLREATGDLRFQNALTTCFSDGKKELKNRLEEVSNMKKRERGMPFVLGALAIALLAGCGLSYESAEGMEETEVTAEALNQTETKLGNEEEAGYQLPILDGALTWGMAFEEAEAVLGSPTVSEEEEFGGTYTWELDEPLECALGDCSELVLYIGKDNLTDDSGAVFSQGLMSASLTIDGTTKETVMSQLESFYGEFSDECGSTAMEQMFQSELPDYFNEDYYCDAWKVEALGEADYERLCEIAEATSEWMGLKTLVAENEVLMDIILSGNATGETYSCSVELYAKYLTYLKAGESAENNEAGGGAEGQAGSEDDDNPEGYVEEASEKTAGLSENETVPLEGLSWGMNVEAASTLYDLSGGEVSQGIYHYALDKAQTVYGCDTEVILVFEDGYGLTGVQGQCQDAAAMETALDERLSDSRTDYSPDDEAAYWTLGAVADRYEEAEIRQALERVDGEELDEENAESVLTGLMGSSLVTWRLYTDGEREGFWEMDASTLVLVSGLMKN